jgi:hypothetical protein
LSILSASEFVIIYTNGKMRPFEPIPGMGEEG